MKTCCKCGKNLENNMKYCFICGIKQDAQDEIPGKKNKTAKNISKNNGKLQYYGRKIKCFFRNLRSKIENYDKKKLSIIGAGSVLAIVFLIFFFRAFVGSGAMSPKGAVKKYLGAIDKENERSIINATMSNRLFHMTDCDKRDLIETIDEKWFNIEHEDVDFKDIRIKSVEKYNTSKVKDYNQKYKDEYDKNPFFSKMVNISGTYRVRENNNSWDKQEFSMIAYKQGGNWYVLDSTILKYADGESVKLDKDRELLYELKSAVDETLSKEEFSKLELDNVEIYENGRINLENLGGNEAFVDAVKEYFDNQRRLTLESKLRRNDSKTSIRISTKNGCSIIRVKSVYEDSEYTITIDKIKQSE